MSTGTTTEGESEFNCEQCGESFASPQALGGHLSSHSKGEGQPTPSEVEDFSDEASQSIIDRLDFSPKESDSLQTAAAKALIDEGDTEGFVEAFGECGHQDCDWGANGFDADHCVKHQSETDEKDSNDGSKETEPQQETVQETAPEPNTDEEQRAAYVAALMKQGLSPEEAESAAKVRFEA